jgi:surface protein
LKKITFLLVFISIFGYAQTAIIDANIQTAVDLWVSDPSAATTTYGNISTWDVSQVTNMSYLFSNKTTFNDDISNWDVSNVTDMGRVFYDASAFNQDISSWRVTNIGFEPDWCSRWSVINQNNKPVWGTCPTASIEDQTQLNISIYPNPTNNTLFIPGNETPIAVAI